MQQKAAGFWRRAWPAPVIFWCQIPGAFWSPDSGDGLNSTGLVSVSFIKGGRNLALISCPESGLQMAPGFRRRNSKNQGREVWQWCSSCVRRLPPEKRIPCPNTDETSGCRLHGACNCQPAPQAVGTAGLLEISGLKCHKQLSARQSRRPLHVTERIGQKLIPFSGLKTMTAFRLIFKYFVVVCAATGSDNQVSDR